MITYTIEVQDSEGEITLIIPSLRDYRALICIVAEIIRSDPLPPDLLAAMPPGYDPARKIVVTRLHHDRKVEETFHITRPSRDEDFQWETIA